MKAIPKSRTGSKNLATNGTRSWQSTPALYFKVIPKSTCGHGNPDSNATRSEESAKSGMGAIPKSLPKVPRAPKGWKNRGYSMSSPS